MSNNVQHLCIYLKLKQTVKLLASPNPRSAGETRLQSSCSTYTNEIPREGLIRSKNPIHTSLVDEVCRIKSIFCRYSLCRIKDQHTFNQIDSMIVEVL